MTILNFARESLRSNGNALRPRGFDKFVVFKETLLHGSTKKLVERLERKGDGAHQTDRFSGAAKKFCKAARFCNGEKKAELLEKSGDDWYCKAQLQPSGNRLEKCDLSIAAYSAAMKANICNSNVASRLQCKLNMIAADLEKSGDETADLASRALHYQMALRCLKQAGAKSRSLLHLLLKQGNAFEKSADFAEKNGELFVYKIKAMLGNAISAYKEADSMLSALDGDHSRAREKISAIVEKLEKRERTYVYCEAWAMPAWSGGN
ncbi:MAG: hypothetical protein WCY41_01995 [Candidatus Micrarchaeia archaeon]